jgi:hypothetical protein
LSGTAAVLLSIAHVAVDSVGNIYIVDRDAYKVKKYSPTGQWLFTIGGSRVDIRDPGTEYGFYSPRFITVHDDDTFSIVDGRNTANPYDSTHPVIVKRFSSTGVFL